MNESVSLEDVYQKLSSLAESYSNGDISAQIETREYLPVIANSILHIRNDNHEANTETVSQQCILTEKEKTLVKQIIDKLLIFNKKQVPLLAKIIGKFEIMDQILSVIDFLIKNELYDEVVDLLIRGDGNAAGNSLSAFRKNQLYDLLHKMPNSYQMAIQNAYYVEYGGDGTSLYQYYIIGESFQAS